MRLPGSRLAVPWPVDLVARIAIIFAALFVGGAIARRFGFHQGWGSVIAVLAVALVNSVLLLVRELPRRGPLFLFRWLVSWVWVVGFLAILWSAMHIRYDQWAIFNASLHVLSMIGLVLLVGWVSCGSAMKGIVLGRPAKAGGKASSGVDDRWVD